MHMQSSGSQARQSTSVGRSRQAVDAKATVRENSVWLRLQRAGEDLAIPVERFELTEDAERGLVVGLVVGMVPASLAGLGLCRHPATIVVARPGSSVEVRCSVSFRGSSEAAHVQVQVQVDGNARADLVRAYAALRCPQLHDRGALEADRVVALFHASHYLDLCATDRGPTAAWCRPDFAGDLSIDSVYRADDATLLGHVSITRAYSRTWLGHQLSTLKGHVASGDCRAALYQHFAEVPRIMDGRDHVFLLGYYDRGVRWHQLFFEGFVASVGDERLASITPWDRFEAVAPIGATPEANTETSTADSAPTRHVIVPIQDRDREVVVDLIRAQLPALAADAFDISVERLVASHLHPEYQRRSIERGRTGLVVRDRDHGGIVGVALCETGSRNLSLFNLFNLAQIYCRAGISRAAQADLIRAVRRFYAARGVDHPIIVAPPRQLDHAGDAGLRWTETMGCIIWSGRSLQRYQTYVDDCFTKIGAAALTRSA